MSEIEIKKQIEQFKDFVRGDGFETKIIGSFAETSPTCVMVRFLRDDRAYYICNYRCFCTMFSLSDDELHRQYCSWSWGVKELSVNRLVRTKTRYDAYLPGYAITDMQFLKEENTMVITARPTKIRCNKDTFALWYYDANRDKETRFYARRGCILCFERVTPGKAKEIAFDDVLDFLTKDESRYLPFNISVTDGLIRSITIDRTSVIKEITDFKITTMSRIDDKLRAITGADGSRYIITTETIFTELGAYEKKTVTIDQFLHCYGTWLGAFKIDKIIYEAVEGGVIYTQFVKEIVYMYEPKKIYISTGRAWGKSQALKTALNYLYGSESVKFTYPFRDSAPCTYCKQEKEKEEMNKFLVPKIEKVLFEDPATIVFWKDGTKTVVRAQDGEKFDREKGLAMAISKKALGNDRGYYFTFQRYKAVDKPATKKETMKTTETPKKPTTKKTKKG